VSLLFCPWCGKVPDSLNLREGSTYRWALVSPKCCGAVEGEIRRESRYDEDFNDADMALAVEWWNDRKVAKQLPTGMEHCTIKFIECPEGHGRLTAANWVQHDCLWCRIKKLEFENECLANANL
jgi:hypothetical protein